MSKPRIIAFYLPQYHPTPDNDKWWGKGFTEWTNVAKARPLFKGHYQPRIPADLGFYDLRLPEVREAQADLAKEAGIYGFCYYHYWFGNGKEELELPFNEVLRLGKPDFPFMLCWANESWHKKFWNKDGKGSSKEMLIEQTYPGEQDIIDHFYRLLPAFKDPRYIRIDGKPAFMIYNPDNHPYNEKFIFIWNNLAKKENIPGIFFIGQLRNNIKNENIEKLKKRGYNAINTVRLWEVLNYQTSLPKRILSKINHILFSKPYIRNIKNAYKYLLTEIEYKSDVYPTMIPNWDHTPRSGANGTVLKNATPQVFGNQIEMMLKCADTKKDTESNLIFIKSWNEWGEGNYIEPDLKYGMGYINTLKEKLSNYKPIIIHN